MAEDKKKASIGRKPESMRDKVSKASNAKSGERRLKKTASAIKKPVGVLSRVAKTEFHLIEQKEGGVKGFLTKSRRMTPSYFRAAYGELKQVTWPTRRETRRLMFAVFAFAIAFGLLITLVDFGLDKLFREAFL